jgi:hypothetical protein
MNMATALAAIKSSWNVLDKSNRTNVEGQHEKGQRKEESHTNGTTLSKLSQFMGVLKPRERSRTSSSSSFSSSTSTTNTSKQQSVSSMLTEYDRDVIAKEIGMNYDAADVVIAIATKYLVIMAPNANADANQLSQSSKLLCGKGLSNISFHDYIARMVRLLSLVYDRQDPNRIGLKSTGIQLLILATIYVDRLLVLRTDFVLHPLNIHRVLFAGMIAIKYSEDIIPDKKLMSMLGGISPKQLKTCEHRFCSLMNFQFWIDPVNALQHQFEQFCLPFHLRHIASPFVPDCVEEEEF